MAGNNNYNNNHLLSLYQTLKDNDMFERKNLSYDQFERDMQGRGYNTQIWKFLRDNGAKVSSHPWEFRKWAGVDEFDNTLWRKNAAKKAQQLVQSANTLQQRSAGIGKYIDGQKGKAVFNTEVKIGKKQKSNVVVSKTTGKAYTQGGEEFNANDKAEMQDAEKLQQLYDKRQQVYNEAVDNGMIADPMDVDAGLSDAEVKRRMMERRKAYATREMNKRGDEIDTQYAGMPQQFNSHTEPTMQAQGYKSSDQEYQLWKTAKQKSEDTMQMLDQQIREERQKKEDGDSWLSQTSSAISNFGKGIWDTVTDYRSWEPGITEMQEANTMLDAKRNIENGSIKEGSDEDIATQVMLTSLRDYDDQQRYQAANGSKAYSNGAMTGISLTLLPQFLITGGSSTLTEGGAKLLTKMGIKEAEKGFQKYAVKAMGRVLSDAARATVLTGALQGGKTYAAIMDDYLGVTNEKGATTYDENGKLKFNEGKSLGRSIYDAGTQQFVENFSELMGEWLPGGEQMSQGLRHIGLSKVADMFAHIGSNGVYQALSYADRYTGVSGIFGEIMEEEFGIALNSMLNNGGSQWSDFIDGDKQFDLMAGLFFSVGAMNAPRYAAGAYSGVQYMRYKHYTDNAEKDAQNVLGGRWDSIRDVIDGTTNDDMTKVVRSYLSQKDKFTSAERNAISKYALNLSRMRGYNTALTANTAQEAEEAKNDPEKQEEMLRGQERNASYVFGANATADQRRGIQLGYEQSRKKLADSIGIEESELEQLSEDDILDKLQDDDQLDMADDFLKKKAAHSGMQDAANQMVEDAKQQATAEVDKMTNLKTGTIQRTTLKSIDEEEDKDVYVVGGNLVTFSDGTIDHENSDKMIVIYNPETKERETISPSRLLQVTEERTAQEVKDEAAEIAAQKVQANNENDISGKVATGSVYSVIDETGATHTIEVGETNQDGTVNATYDGQPMVSTIEALQQERNMSDAALAQVQSSAEAQSQTKQNDDESGLQGEEAVADEVKDFVDNIEFDRMIDEDGSIIPVDVEKPERGHTYYKTGQTGQGNSARYNIAEFDANMNYVGTHRMTATDVVLNDPMSVDEKKEQLRSSVVSEYLQSINEHQQERQAEENNDANDINDNVEEPQQEQREVDEVATDNVAESKEDTSALSRIPVDEKTQEPLFEQVDSETALQGLNELTGNNTNSVTAIVNAQIQQANKALETLKAKKPKKTTPKLQGSPMEMLKAQQQAEAKYESDMEKYNAQVDAAEQKVKVWNNIASAMLQEQEPKRKEKATETNEINNADASNEDATVKLNAKKRLVERQEVNGVDTNMLDNNTDSEVLDKVEEGHEGVTDWFMPKAMRKDIEKIAKKLGYNVQWLYTNDKSNGFFVGNTVYLSLDAERPYQLVFGHEMTHAIKSQHPQLYKQLMDAAKAMYADDEEFQKRVEDTTELYRSRMGGYFTTDAEGNKVEDMDAYTEEVVADTMGEAIFNAGLMRDIAFNLDHPTLAAIRDAITSLLQHLTGKNLKNAVDSLSVITDVYNQAYEEHKQGKTGEETEIPESDAAYSIRQKPAPKETKKGYAVFIVKQDRKGKTKLVPKMLSNDPGAPAFTWLDAETGKMKRDENGTPLQNADGRAMVSVNGLQSGGTTGNKLAWRPGKHLCAYPNAAQFMKKDGTIPKNVVFFEVEYAADPELHKKYQTEAWELGMKKSGKYDNTRGGLPYIPEDSYYIYRTNQISEGAAPMIITGAYKINRALTDAEAKQLNQENGGTWAPREGGELTAEGLKQMGVDKEGLKRLNDNFDFDSIAEKHDESADAIALPGYVHRNINWEDPELQKAIKENGQDIDEYKNGYSAPSEEKVKYSLIGEKGASALDHAEEVTTRLDNLAVAREMEEAKKDAKTIKLATGWERGADGKWRYEIPDFTIKNPEEWIKKRTLKLSDVIDDDCEIFKSYPEAKDIVFKKGRSKSGAWYDDGVIEVGLGDLREAMRWHPGTGVDFEKRWIRTVMLHEVQHYIQEKEGFAQGGNSNMIIDPTFNEKMQQIVAEEKQVLDEWNALPSSERSNPLKLSPRAAKIYRRYNDVQERGNTLRKNAKIGKDGYHRLAGEVESRNVEYRSVMTDEERRNSLAEETEDVARKDQIFLFGEGGENHMGTRTNKRMKKVGEYYEGSKDLSKEQQVVIDVFKGSKDRETIHVTSFDGKNVKLEMQQGNEPNSGTRHSLWRHFETASGAYSLDEIVLIPSIVEEGQRKEREKNVVYQKVIDGVRYTVYTDKKGNKEIFHDFYTNRKTALPTSFSEEITNTQSSARTSDNTISVANVANNSDTTNNSAKNLQTGEEVKGLSTAVTDGNSDIKDASGEVVAQTDADHKVKLSLRTYTPWVDNFGRQHEGTRAQVLEYMKKNGFADDQIKYMLDTMDYWYKYFNKLAEFTNPDGTYRFDELHRWNERQPQYKAIGENIENVVSTAIKNGEYAVNQELSTDCIKREAFTKLVNHLIARGADLSAMGPAQINTIKDMMRKYGIQVACDLCFVEGKRLGIVNWAQTFVDDWNKALEAAGFNPDELEDFNFGHYAYDENGNVIGDAAFVPTEEYKNSTQVRAINEAYDLLTQRGKEYYDAMKKRNVANWKQWLKDNQVAKKWKANHKGEKWSESYLTNDQKEIKHSFLTFGVDDPKKIYRNSMEYAKRYAEMEKKYQEKHPGKAFTPTKTQLEDLGKIRNREIRDIFEKMQRLIIEFPEMRKKMQLSDLLGSKGLMQIRQENGEGYAQLWSLILGRFGSGTPKPIQDAVPYSGEIFDITNGLISKAYEEGGARMFSFSDFDITKVFDIMQIYWDMAAREMKLQSYSKEAAYIIMFGKTGAKINMSTLPKAVVSEDLQRRYNDAKKDEERNAAQKEGAEYAGLITDEDGRIVDLSWSEEHSLKPDFCQSIFRDPERNGNCGAVTVGASVNHSIFAAAQPWIRMVIPFHLSGMPIEARKRTDVNWYFDNTPHQNTRVKIGGNWVSIHSEKAKKAKLQDFNFYENEDSEDWDMRQRCRDYLKWCDEKGYTPRFEWGIDSDHYKEWCAGKGYTPNQQIVDIMDNDMTDGVWNGYYKFITDFNAYKPVLDKMGNPVFDENGHLVETVAKHMPVTTNIKLSDAERRAVFGDITGDATEFADMSVLQNRENSINYADANMQKMAAEVQQYLDMTRKHQEGEVTDADIEQAEADMKGEGGTFFNSANDAEILMEAEKENIPQTFDNFLASDGMKYSIRNEQERQGAENAYDFAKENRPDSYHQYAVLDMSKPGLLPQYYMKQQLADKWRRYANKLQWGNYKMFDLDKPFEENVTKLKGAFPEQYAKYSLKEVNEEFNERLDELVNNPNQKDKILHLGHTSSFLQNGSIADADIELDFDKLIRKSNEGYKHEHPFDATDIKDLPIAIANPISVFDNTHGLNDGQVILTELKKDDRNFIVAIKTENQHRKGGIVLQVNKISTLFPKDARGVINWYIQDKATNIDKDKALHFIEALQNHPGTTITSEELDSAAKIINDFKNPNTIAENLSESPKYSLRETKFKHELAEWKKQNGLPKTAKEPQVPIRDINETDDEWKQRLAEYRKEAALWKTAPTYEADLVVGDDAEATYNRALQRKSIQARIVIQDGMLAIHEAQNAISREVGSKIGTQEDAYNAENRSHGKAKNEMEEYNHFYLEPLRKAYNALKNQMGGYGYVKNYLMAKHGLERNAYMAFMAAAEEQVKTEIDDIKKRHAKIDAKIAADKTLSAADKQQQRADNKQQEKDEIDKVQSARERLTDYQNDLGRMMNDADYRAGRINFETYRQRDNSFRIQYAPMYLNHRYDKMGIPRDFSGLSALFGNETKRDFELEAGDYVTETENKHGGYTDDLWDAIHAATNKTLFDSYRAGMMTKKQYQSVHDMFQDYIPLRGWNETTADEVWDYVQAGNGAMSSILQAMHGRESIADDPIAYIEQMAQSAIIINNKNDVKQRLLLLARNHPTSLLTLSKAWYIKTTDTQGNEKWIPASPNIPSDVKTSKEVQQYIDQFEQNMELLEKTGDATQKKDGLHIEYPQTTGQEREHEIRVMDRGQEYVIYVNGDPALAHAINDTRSEKAREKSGLIDKATAKVGRFLSQVYTSFSPMFVPSNYFRDLTMVSASTAIREDGHYNALLYKNFLQNWGIHKLVAAYSNGSLKQRIDNGTATRNEEDFYNYMMNGGETGYVTSVTVDDFKSKIMSELGKMDEHKLNPKKVWRAYAEAVEFLNRGVEASNRYLVYKTSIEYGRSVEEAINDAKNVTLNFNRKGTGEHGVQVIRNLYLFINPAIQSLQTLGALAKDHPGKLSAVAMAWIASGALVPAFNQAMLSAFGDDDDKDKYWRMAKWDRRNNAILYIPFSKDIFGEANFVKIPLAQEFRAFYGLGDMLASIGSSSELSKQTVKEYASDIMGQILDLMPLDPTGYGGQPLLALMPDALRWPFALAMNTDFTGKPISKESEYNQYMPTYTKAYKGTPDWLVQTSRTINAIGNDFPDEHQNGIDRTGLINPAKADYVLKTLLGGSYTFLSKGAGVATKMLREGPGAISTADVPLWSSFVINPNNRPQSQKQGDGFWDMADQCARVESEIGTIRKEAETNNDFEKLKRYVHSADYREYLDNKDKVDAYQEQKKIEKLVAKGQGDTYKPHKTTADDIYNKHRTIDDIYEDMKLDILWKKLNAYDTKFNALGGWSKEPGRTFHRDHPEEFTALRMAKIHKELLSTMKKLMYINGKDKSTEAKMKRVRKQRQILLQELETATKNIKAPE